MNHPFKIAIVSALCAFPSIAAACSCAPPPAPKIALQKAAAVFVGRVTSVKRGNANTFQFAISKQWKGINGKTASIVSASDSAACGINFDSDRDYLVYAFKTEGDEQLRTNLCTRTKRAADAAAELTELGAPKTDGADYTVANNGEVQLNVTRNLGSTVRPTTILSKALDADEKSQLFRLNWNTDADRGTALYNRANSTFKVYSRSQNDGKIEVRSTLYSGVTDEFFKQAATTLYNGKNSLPAGVTKIDLGSKIVQVSR